MPWIRRHFRAEDTDFISCGGTTPQYPDALRRYLEYNRSGGVVANGQGTIAISDVMVQLRIDTTVILHKRVGVVGCLTGFAKLHFDEFGASEEGK